MGNVKNYKMILAIGIYFLSTVRMTKTKISCLCMVSLIFFIIMAGCSENDKKHEEGEFEEFEKNYMYHLDKRLIRNGEKGAWVTDVDTTNMEYGEPLYSMTGLVFRENGTMDRIGKKREDGEWEITSLCYHDYQPDSLYPCGYWAIISGYFCEERECEKGEILNEARSIYPYKSWAEYFDHLMGTYEKIYARYGIRCYYDNDEKTEYCIDGKYFYTINEDTITFGKNGNFKYGKYVWLPDIEIFFNNWRKENKT